MHGIAHQHAGSHLVRRQRGGGDGGNDDTVAIITQFIAVTEGEEPAEPTRKPGIVLLPPVSRVRETTTTGEVDEPEETDKPTTTARMPSSTQGSDNGLIVEETGITKSPPKAASTLMVATSSPTPSPASSIAGLVSATAATISATASSSSSSSSSAAPADSEDGMSTGAKAGLALGVLLVVCTALTCSLLLYRHKKNQAAAAAAQKNEKTAPHVMVGAAPAASIRSTRTASTAPRLSLRPVTQFDPTFSNEQRKSGANLLNVAAAAAAAGGAVAQSQSRNLSPSASAERSTSAWERRGAANAPVADPFKDPETQSGPPSANPFGNKAAVDNQQASIPDSPPNASPMASAMHSSQATADFANSAPSIAVADVNAAALVGVASPIPPPTSELHPPPSVASNNAIVPPSPAWTEDIPASPGPASTGPPPVATAMAGAGPQSPAPGPVPNNVHCVQLDFKPSMQDELDLHAGQLVRMLHEYDDGWALCIRMDRSQQGVVPRTCLSKHPVKPRNGPPRNGPPRHGPPRQGPPPPGNMRGPPIRPQMGQGGTQPRPLSPAGGMNSLSMSQGSPGPRQMSPHQMSPQQMQGPRMRSNSNAPQQGPPRGRSNSNAPYASPRRSKSPGPYGGEPQMAPPTQMDSRPRSNSASQAGNPRQGPAPGPSPMNPNAITSDGPVPMPSRKPVLGMAL